MNCTRPISGYRKIGGGFTTNASLAFKDRPLTVSCGCCTSCRINKTQERAIRCVHEAQSWDENIFLTLTFDNESIPKDKNLDYEIFKKFFKKLRYHANKKIRHFTCGEYGGNLVNKNNIWLWDRDNYREKNMKLPEYPRAHFHSIVFNYCPKDFEIIDSNHMNQPIYTSKKLNKIWGNGKVYFGEVTPQSCAYVARYVMKKQSSNERLDYVAKYGQEIIDKATGEIICVHPTTPEFAYSSTQPPIGNKWIEQYWKTDCFNQGFIVGPAPQHKKYPIPRYYWNWLEKNHPKDFEAYKKRERTRLKLKEDKIAADNTWQRNEVKEYCLDRKVNKLKRNL